MRVLRIMFIKSLLVLLVVSLSAPVTLPFPESLGVALARSSDVAAARSRFEQGDILQARDILARVAPRLKGRERADAFQLLGICYFLTGQRDQARDAFQETLRLNPKATLAKRDVLDPALGDFFQALKSRVPKSAGAASRGSGRGAPALGGTARGNVAVIRVNTNAPGATVFANGLFVGTASQPIELPPGSYKITVSAAGFNPATRNLTVRAGQSETLKFVLEDPQELARRQAAASAAAQAAQARRARDEGAKAAARQQAERANARGAVGIDYQADLPRGRQSLADEFRQDQAPPRPPTPPPPAPPMPAQPRKPPASGGQPPAYGAQPPAYGAQPPAYGAQPPAYGTQPPDYGAQPPAYGAQPPAYGAQPPAYGAQPPAYGAQPQPYGGQPQPYGGQSQPYGAQPPAYGAQPPPYGAQPPAYGQESAPAAARSPGVRSRKIGVSDKSAFVAVMPFGIGQFQNHSYGLGTTSALLQVGALGWGIYSYTLYSSAEAAFQEDSRNSSNTLEQSYIDETQAYLARWKLNSAIGFLGFGAVWIASGIEALASLNDGYRAGNDRRVGSSPAEDLREDTESPTDRVARTQSPFRLVPVARWEDQRFGLELRYRF